MDRVLATALYLRSMSAPILIDNAGPADIPVLQALVNSAYRGDSSKKGWTTEADLLDGIRIDAAALSNIFANPHATILKALTADGKVVGCVNLEQQQKAMYLGMLTVDPTLQNAGIGKLLLQAGEKLASFKGCTKVVMTVISQRDTLINWYKRNGYQSTGERKPFPNDPRFGIPKQPLEFIVMEKKLD